MSSAPLLRSALMTPSGTLAATSGCAPCLSRSCSRQHRCQARLYPPAVWSSLLHATHMEQDALRCLIANASSGHTKGAANMAYSDFDPALLATFSCRSHGGRRSYTCHAVASTETLTPSCQPASRSCNAIIRVAIGLPEAAAGAPQPTLHAVHLCRLTWSRRCWTPRLGMPL